MRYADYPTLLAYAVESNLGRIERTNPAKEAEHTKVISTFLPDRQFRAGSSQRLDNALQVTKQRVTSPNPKPQPDIVAACTLPHPLAS